MRKLLVFAVMLALAGSALAFDLGNQAGDNTVLRTHWSNQATGLVSDEVFELKMTPSAWGEWKFD